LVAPSLLLFQLARGWLEGVIQPLALSVQARAVGRHQQGAVVGLRQPHLPIHPADLPRGSYCRVAKCRRSGMNAWRA
jgi:hypothetical protein